MIPLVVRIYNQAALNIYILINNSNCIPPRRRKEQTMHPDLEKAKSALKSENCTCVLALGNVIFRSSESGLKPLMDWMYSGNNYMGFMVADKIVGRAAAFIIIAMGIREVYAEVISESAKKLLENNQISVTAETVVPEILNADKTDVYPLDKAVEGIENAADALMPIELAIVRMNL